ncbi:MAG: hypothetical protein Q8M94_00145, partial [Ignavibacteria bacterium]|nr:hypothetical protein [Ignavibacteria bacterium]
ICNISNIKLTGFNFIDNRTANYGTMFYLGGAEADGYVFRDSLIVIENCRIVGNGLASMIYFNGYKITVKDCYIEQPSETSLGDNDPFGMSGGRGGHTIDGCTIIMRNGNEETTAHRDAIQISNIGQDGDVRQQITISNNFIIDTNPNGVSWNNMIYNYNGLGAGDNNMRLLIYNNIIVTRKINTSCGGIAVGRLNDLYKISLYILNNTIIMKGIGGSTSTPITNWGLDTLMVRNNLIVQDTTVNNFLNLNIRGSSYYNVNNNYYTEYDGIDGTEIFATMGSAWTWNAWRGAGYDLNSSVGISSNVSFINKYGENKADYYTTTGRDLGTDLSSTYPFLATDILGNPRTGTWDMGALEYQGSQSSNINVKSKVFLQGPFNTNSMNTNLSQNGLLPNSQPFNTAPWNYNGSESLSSGSSSSYVDWVLVELRNSSNPLQVVSRKAAILKNDGSLLNSDGSIGVPFSNVQEGSYYIAIFHRNHLPIMSASPISLSANTPIY